MRKFVFGLAALAIVLTLAGLGWSVLWSYAAGQAETRLAGWIAAEQTQGRTWTCPARRVGGYPFAIIVRCTDPRFEGASGDRVVRASVAALAAEVAVTHLGRLDVNVTAPLTYKTNDGSVALTAAWSALTVSLDGIPDVKRVSLRGADVEVSGAFPDAKSEGGVAARIDATFAPGTDRATLDFDIAIGNATLPPLDRLLNSPAPVDMVLTGRLDHADVAGGITPDQTIEHWRQAGGRVEVAASRMSHADASLAATGTVGLDEAHRPQGRLQASFVGLEPILKRYGINGNFAAAGALLNSLFGSRTPPPETPVAGAITLPISLNNGRLGIGPIRTSVELPPLY